MNMSAYDRLWRRIRVNEDGCWIYTGCLDQCGYGSAWSERGTVERVHQIMYRLARGGDPPAGLEIDHLCRTRACANPDHLEPVTHLENVRRSYDVMVASLRRRAAARTHCKRGHEFTPENTWVATSRAGGPSRTCRTCTRARKRRDYHAKVSSS